MAEGEAAGMYRSEKNCFKPREVLPCPEVLTVATFVPASISQQCGAFSPVPWKDRGCGTWQAGASLLRNGAALPASCL